MFNADQVDQGVTVINHTITEAAGDKDTGNPGTVTLHLGLTVPVADLQRELQEIIVPVISSDSIKLNDQLTDSGAFYLTKQYVYQKPLVKVERTDNGADEATYHVTVSGDYAGFRSTNSEFTGHPADLETDGPGRTDARGWYSELQARPAGG